MKRFVTKSYRGLQARTLVAYTIGFPLLALLFTGSLFAADFERGRDAFRAGDFQQALSEWQPLAQSGNARAQYALGLMHEYGRGLQRDDVEAVNWYIRAAEQDHSDAQYRLGVLYENGWGVTPDPSEAAHWYMKAARHGHAFAQHDLAFMHLEGKGRSSGQGSSLQVVENCVCAARFSDDQTPLCSVENAQRRRNSYG